MTEIKNFCDNSPMKIASMIDASCGKIVYLSQYGGSMHFQHSMTQTQAREMAEALIAEANKLDGDL